MNNRYPTIDKTSKNLYDFYNHMAKQLLIIVGVFFILSTIAVPFAFAQDIPVGMALTINLGDETVREGDIISATEKGFALSTSLYDKNIKGVVTANPAIDINLSTTGSNYPVISTGKGVVNVSTTNGTIKTGDYITSSTLPGIGIKATKSGHVMGKALEDYTETDPKKIGKIKVELGIQFVVLKTTQNSLLNIFQLSTLATYEEPLTVFKYMIAAVVVILSFILGFLSFGRVAANGVEAIGRNPSASKMIQLGVVLNVVITIAISAIGLLLALFIIK